MFNVNLLVPLCLVPDFSVGHPTSFTVFIVELSFNRALQPSYNVAEALVKRNGTTDLTYMYYYNNIIYILQLFLWNCFC